MSNRKGEPEKTYFRSYRLESANGKWFFRVREQEDLIGPYQSSEAAQRAADIYLGKTGDKRNQTKTLADQYIARNFSR